MDTTIISGFPGVGKTIIHQFNEDKTTLDTDSSAFATNFPNDYIDYIKSNIGKADLIFVSAHSEVRRGLEQQGLDYTLVYPDSQLKAEYVQRFTNQGYPESFIIHMIKDWDMLLKSMTAETFPKKIVLKSGEYLANAIGEENYFD